jgi:hypothetical protein
MADPVGAGGRRFRDQFQEPGNAPGTFACFDMIAIDDGDPGGIVTAILEPAESIEEDGGGLRFADISDYATHGALG